MNRRLTSRLRRGGALKGMTLVEIMIVVIIMALIATGVAFAVIPMLQDARETQARTDMGVIQQATTLYIVHNGNCPSSVQDLVDAQRLSSAARTVDPWGNDFTIECDGDSEPVINSPGRDGELGTEDDISTDERPEE